MMSNYITVHDLPVPKQSEFFIAVGKQSIHSFMMLGVVLPDGRKQLLARVGKTNRIDEDFNNPLKMTTKNLVSETLAHLADEHIFRAENVIVDINYQAYAINFDQACDFLRLIKEINLNQQQDPIYQSPVIKAYCPIEDGETVVFRYQNIAELNETTGKKLENTDEFTANTSRLNVSNTCRTTAVNMVEAILGFRTKISSMFLKNPRFQGKLVGGSPDVNFYILPLPPTAYDDKSEHEIKTMKKLYKQLEEIPKKNSENSQTMEKFNSVKELYNSIAGSNNLSANDLLSKIVQHEAEHDATLKLKRDPNFLSRLFNVSSSTEKTFKNIKHSLEKINNAEDDENENNQDFNPS